MEKNSMVNRQMWMRYVLAPTWKDPLSKSFIHGVWITAVEIETKKSIPLPHQKQVFRKTGRK